MAARKKTRKPMSEEARAAASERMRKLNEVKRARVAAPEEEPGESFPSSLPAGHTCQWLPGDYRAHDGNGWRLAAAYCPVGKHWESVDA